MSSTNTVISQLSFTCTALRAPRSRSVCYCSFVSMHARTHENTHTHTHTCMCTCTCTQSKQNRKTRNAHMKPVKLNCVFVCLAMSVCLSVSLPHVWLCLCCGLPAVVELVAACSEAERELQAADEEDWSMEADPVGSIHPCPAVSTAQVPAGGEIHHINYSEQSMACSTTIINRSWGREKNEHTHFQPQCWKMLNSRPVAHHPMTFSHQT